MIMSLASSYRHVVLKDQLRKENAGIGMYTNIPNRLRVDR